MQDGVDVFAQLRRGLLALDLQILLLGTGHPDAERYFSHVSWLRPDRFRAFIGFDNPRAHRIEAGSDFFLMPSRFEPFGFNQPYNLRYGPPPLVRATGGAAPTGTPNPQTTRSGHCVPP